MADDPGPSESADGRDDPSVGTESSGRPAGEGVQEQTEPGPGDGGSEVDHAADAVQGETEPPDVASGTDGSDVSEADDPPVDDAEAAEDADVPEDVRAYDRFSKVDRASYDRVNGFLRDRTYITAREWAIARLCADFRTATGVEMTKIGQNLPELVPFMTDTYSPQAVNQARSAFGEKVRKAGATFLYGAMSGFFTADELDDLMYESTEVAKFLLEVEGVELSVDEELEAEERISTVMREVRRASAELRHEGVTCPECGHEIGDDWD